MLIRFSLKLRVQRADAAAEAAHAERLAALAKASKSGSVWARLEEVELQPELEPV